MSTEDPPSNNSSPRLSFSQDLARPENQLPHPRPVYSSNTDFDFNVSIDTDSSPADELFSDGKIIPLLQKCPDPDPIAAPASEKKGGGKKSLWKLGRSASVNCEPSGMMKINFLRSYSTGSGRDLNAKPQPHPKPQRVKSLKKSNYFDGEKRGVCGRGGGMNPLPLMPKERGLIGILLCNCAGGGANKGGIDY